MNAEKVKELLQLEPHREGGFFRRTYAAKMSVAITSDTDKPSVNDSNNGIQRPIMTSIYYLLTNESPTMYLNINRSDVIHYYHMGAPVQFRFIHPNGQLVQETLGPDLSSGEKLQVIVPGGCWKCAAMKTATYEGFSLTSEAVAPGFDYEDNKLATEAEIKSKFPHLWETLRMCIAKQQ